MSTAIGEKRLSTKHAERGARRRARQSKAHPDCRSATIKSRVKKISLALSSGRDNHPPAATAKMAILIVAVFPSRLSRYTLLSEIKRFWQAERRKIVKLCEQARFRDPSGLADKLLLLVQGARNERNCYGFGGPSQKVGEAGDDLMVVHGAERKPLMEV